ncbi:ScnB [Nonomuraea sp. NPDC059194]|uniref:ScnB n=1 Tax=Nonomuraea sp. NPDC059194 TaxID=3346764 RepID=UPI0036A3B3AD
MKAYDVLMETLREFDEHEPAVWESRMQATCECLSAGGALDDLERRQAEDRLGESVYAGFPVRTRSALAVAHSLMDRRVFTEDELRRKMEGVRARLTEQ